MLMPVSLALLVVLCYYLVEGLVKDPPEVQSSPAPLTTLRTAQSAAISPNIIFFEDMEGPTPFSKAQDVEAGAWNYALQFVSHPTFEGRKSARFEIREDQPLVKGGKRSEVTIIRGKQLPGKSMWYSYALYFPIDYTKDRQQEIINQWFQDRTPATAVRVKDDRIYLHTGSSNEPDNRVWIDMGAVNKGYWNTFVYHFIHSSGSDGLIEVWRDGVKLVTRQGGNMYNLDIMPKFKVGLYKSAFKYGSSDVTYRVIYFDNIKVGNASATFALMDPSNTSLGPALKPK